VNDTLVPKVRAWFDPSEPDKDGFWFGGWHRELVRGEDGKPELAGAHDQDGALPVAAVLDAWARDWADHLEVSLPKAEVPALVSWLSVNLAWALDNHPAVDEFHAEITVMLYSMRTLLNVSRKPIHLSEGCPSCGYVALKRDPGGGDVICGQCRRSWEHHEFERLAVVLADDGEAA
jgi:hypothetical protein